ncbi:hypothetical protein Hanom_Chr06g00558601 [Helianthus anomalus]
MSNTICNILSELQNFYFIFMPNFRRCSLSLKLVSFVPNVLQYYTLCPLAPSQLIFSVKSNHVTCT